MSLKTSVSREGENLYYNVFISNNTNHDVALDINQVLSDPLISKPNEYQMSIVKFVLPGANIPLFNNNILLPALTYTDPKKFVTVIRWDGAGVKTVAQNALVWTPTGYLSSSSFNNFAVYNYQSVMNVLNQALYNSFITLGVAAADIPYFTYTSDDLINFVIPTATCRNNLQGTILPPNTGVSTYQIFVSSEIGQWLQGLDLFYTESVPYGIVDDNYKYTQLLNIKANYVSTTSPPWGTGPTFPLTIKSGFSSTGYFNRSKSIIITSRNIPTTKESFPIINAVDSSPLSYLNNTNTSSTLNIVSEFSIVPQNGSDTRQYLEYLPTAEYRMVDLANAPPLTVVDFQVWYLNSESNQTTGFNLDKLLLYPGQTFSMKILFRKKG